MNTSLGMRGADWQLSDGSTMRLTVTQVAFLRALGECGTVKGACEAAGLSLSAYKSWRKSPEFLEAYQDAVDAFCDALETEAVRRARDGVKTIKFTSAGRPIKDPRKHDPSGNVLPGFENDPWYYEESFSDRLLELLLRAKRPEEFALRVRHDLIGGSEGSAVVMLAAARRVALVDPVLSDRLCELLEKVQAAPEIQPVATIGTLAANCETQKAIDGWN